jgi:hypothetical protein
MTFAVRFFVSWRVLILRHSVGKEETASLEYCKMFTIVKINVREDLIFSNEKSRPPYILRVWTIRDQEV